MASRLQFELSYKCSHITFSQVRRDIIVIHINWNVQRSIGLQCHKFQYRQWFLCFK